MSELIQLENLPVEALAEMANEAAAACEASGRKTVEHAATSGRALLAAKAQVKHGEWLSWLADNFHWSQQRASQFMEIANYYARSNLESAETIQGALRMIADSPEKQAKKQEREAKKQERQPEKTEAPPKPPAPAPPTPAPLTKLERPAWLANPDELERPEETDLPPLPRTNTHHTSENRRTPDARETDRIGLVSPDDPRDLQDGGWYVWSEARNRLLPVTDEEILRRADEIRDRRGARVQQVMPVIPWPPETAPVVEHAKDTSPVVERQTESVRSKTGKAPTAQQLGNVLRHRQYSDPFWTDAMVAAVERWIEYKQSLTGKAKIRSVQQWEVALTRMENVIAAKGWPAVADMIEKAIANGWQGWEHETSDRKSRGMAGGRIYAQLEKAQVKYDPLPE